MFNYRQISSDLIKDLPDRTGDVISRRFGLNQNTLQDKRESLESIGKDYGITRERVRQIERDGLMRMKERSKRYDSVFSNFQEKMSYFGGLKKEDLYVRSIGEQDMRNHILFLLSVSDSFYRFSENRDFHPFWSIDTKSFNSASSTVKSIKEVLEQEKKPLSIEYCAKLAAALPSKIGSYLEISKDLHLTDDGMFGLKSWPEVNPKGIKDKAHLVLKKAGKPLHFTEVAKLIGETTLPQTVHNELIKDSRFVLVGRGIYALREWGYEPGEIKEVIKKILTTANRPMDKEEIVREVLKRRVVKENTVLQNLSNKRYFQRDSSGRYLIS